MATQQEIIDFVVNWRETYSRENNVVFNAVLNEEQSKKFLLDIQRQG